MSNKGTDHSCLKCVEPDNDDMVCCDKCDGWYHFSCVGVNESISDKSWMCSTCNDLIKAAALKSKEKGTNATNNSTSKELHAAIPIAMNDDKQLSAPKNLSELESTLSKCASSKPHKKSRRLLEEIKILEEEERLLRQKETILNRKKELLKSIEPNGDEVEEIWCDDPNAESTKNRASVDLQNEACEAPACEQLDEMRSIITTMTKKMRELELKNKISERQQSATQWLPGVTTNVFEVSRHDTLSRSDTKLLTREQIAARNSFARDLPKFSGNPEDWPLFLATYQQTTDMCGFTESENLLRLRNALDGEALKSVRNLLFHTSCVPQIMETLRIKFGRPELVLNILLKRVRDLAPIKENKLETLVDFALEVQNIVATMKSADLKNYINNPELEQELVLKLPGIIAAFWGMHKLTLLTCDLENFGSWLFQFAQGANSVLIPERYMSKTTKRGNVNTHAEFNKQRCIACDYYCDELSLCTTFQTLSRAKKWSLVRGNNLCRRCLKPHSISLCKSGKLCGIENCQFLHHPLLHKETHGILNIAKVSNGGVLFRVLPVILYGNGTQIRTYAFFDDGSSLTLMEEGLLRDLNLEGKPSPLCLKWTAGTHRYEDDSVVLSLQISGDSIKACFDLNNVHTVKSLDLPRQSLDVHQLKTKYTYLKDVPMVSYIDAEPRLLIGLNKSWLGSCLKSRERIISEPVAEKTRLGWTIKGPFADGLHGVSVTAFHACGEVSENDELLQTVKRFILLDNLDVTPSSSNLTTSIEDNEGFRQLQEYTHKVGKQYETRLLWKLPKVYHPDSYSMAKRRAQCLKLKLSRDPEMLSAMQGKIDDYLAKGYAIHLTGHLSLERSKCWYLPIFPVVNPNKPSKLRIVWDAAAKVNGVSLNSMLLKGPDFTSPLVDVLRRFRQNRFAISGDIKEMYHQVKIHPDDQNYQRFLWYENGRKEPTMYALTVMSFGATCSPSAAQYVKNTNAKLFSATHPRAVEAIIDNHYVDDFLDCADTEEEVLRLAQDVEFIHAEGGFKIRNWRSNSENVSRTLNGTESVDLNLDADQAMGMEKVLGMWWLTSEDCFSFKVSQKYKDCEYLTGKCRPTKRQVLSIVMSIFDPLGLVSFYVMYAKIILQDIWRSGCGWDEDIHHSEYTRWLRWTQHLSDIEQLKIPRYFFNESSKNIKDMELHTFVDASESGFAAVAYVRFLMGNSSKCCLIGGKTKVAPLKMLSVPRLELQSALLGTRLAKSITSSLKIKFSQQVFWTDSKTVLSWIRSDHRKYSQFVAFRVSEILETTEVDDWRWIPSAENVADEATKWQKTQIISSNSRWFSGPHFLRKKTDEWPEEEDKINTVDELRPQYIGFHEKVRTIKLLVNPNRFSRWSRFLGATSTLFSTIRKWKSVIKGDRNLPFSKIQEDIICAEMLIWKSIQNEAFGDELAVLKRKAHLSSSSPLFKLAAYLDENGIIRLESRVQLCGRQDPIILPKEHYVTFLVVMDYHVKYLHQNHETVVNEIRQAFWIPRLRSVLKKARKVCQYCRIVNANPNPPKMSALPTPRLASFQRPFTYVGIDYFGPISVVVRRSSEKRYGVLFTCLTTRAIHLEVAYSLSTASCILAIRSFISRRGIPHEFWSDNGTNFRGAERELSDAFSLMDKNEIIKAFTTSCTSWKFIPPSSPHMGGAWERLVRSVKSALASILPRHRLTDELLRGSMVEVENIVNSRPLTYIPIEHDEQESLTPNHFIHGSSNGMKPLATPDADTTSLRHGWKISQKIADSFWRSWLKEYLPIITRRSKWFQTVKPIEVGDVVYIVDPNNPRNCWPKGRVTSAKKGRDGQVRSALVKTLTGVYERPATKIAVLPLVNEVGPQKDIPGGSVAEIQQI